MIGTDYYYRSGASVEPAPAFHRDGKVFRTTDGAIHTWAYGSEFPTLRMWMDGRDLEPLFADRYSVGQLGFGVFCTSEDPLNRLGEGGPYTDAEILDALEAFADDLRDHGFNLEACLFQGTDHGTMPGLDRQVHFWNAALELAAIRPWMHVSFSREAFKQPFRNDPAFHGPADQVWDGGATRDGVDYTRLAHAGSHYAYQASRTDDWPRKTKSAWDVTQMFGKGCVTVEPMGADDVNQPGRRSNVPDDFFWSAANARLLSMGSYFHSTAGATGQLFGPVTRSCAAAHFRALSIIPCASQLGTYAKSLPWGAAVQSYDDVPGGSLRTYGSVLSLNEQWTVVTRPGPNYPRSADGLIDPPMVHGWRVIERFLDASGTVLHCAR